MGNQIPSASTPLLSTVGQTVQTVRDINQTVNTLKEIRNYSCSLKVVEVVKNGLFIVGIFSLGAAGYGFAVKDSVDISSFGLEIGGAIFSVLTCSGGWCLRRMMPIEHKQDHLDQLHEEIVGFAKERQQLQTEVITLKGERERLDAVVVETRQKLDKLENAIHESTQKLTEASAKMEVNVREIKTATVQTRDNIQQTKTNTEAIQSTIQSIQQIENQERNSTYIPDPRLASYQQKAAVIEQQNGTNPKGDQPE